MIKINEKKGNAFAADRTEQRPEEERQYAGFWSLIGRRLKICGQLNSPKLL